VKPVRIELREMALAALDAAEGDALALFLGPERPLQGLAGIADWRLAGAISRALFQGHYRGAPGEQLLVPSQGRLRLPRVFCFGVADPPGQETAFREVAYRALDALLRAGSRVHAISLPPTIGMGAGPLARFWLEATLRFPPERQLLFGDVHALRRDLSAARDALGAAVEIAAAETPAPRALGPSLPGLAGVLR
jgi:hypothetical protein